MERTTGDSGMYSRKRRRFFRLYTFKSASYQTSKATGVYVNRSPSPESRLRHRKSTRQPSDVKTWYLAS